MTNLPIIHFDYEFSPVGQKTKLLLTLTSTPFKRVDQPLVLPRSDLESLGITYRRIPLLAVGKDIFLDSRLIISTVLDDLNGSDRIPNNPATDQAWAAWGVETFVAVLALVPTSALSPEFVKDRSTVFPLIAREDFATLRPSAVAELRSRLAFLETTVLGASNSGPFINGAEASVADVHIVWPLVWALLWLGAKEEPQLSKQHFPKVWNLIESLPQEKPETIEFAKAAETIKGSDYYVQKLSIQDDDPLGLSAGQDVTVESTDAAPGKHPQAGTLVGTSLHGFTIELANGIRLHFPREGYVVRKA